MTSSVQPEVHNISQRRQRRSEPRSQGICTAQKFPEDRSSGFTKYSSEISNYASIGASVIPGSGTGPVTYLVTVSDLQPEHDGNNYVVKFADDTST